MTETIQPALTPEEWKNLPLLRDRLLLWTKELSAGDPFHLAAMSNALLDDGDPRKITWADVFELRDVASEPRPWSGDDATERAESVAAIAAKLAALLPP